MPDQSTTLLHISDLRIKPGEEFEHTVMLDALIRRVKQDMDGGKHPEVVAVTGDIAYNGDKAEYGLAGEFLQKLKDTLSLAPHHFYIVPGNHDVKRTKYRPTDKPECGLFTRDQGTYSFRHLTFQEFLTAQYMATEFSDHVAGIRPFWEDDWYKEVVELYISYLSIEYHKIAQEIILSALDKDDRPPVQTVAFSRPGHARYYKNTP